MNAERTGWNRSSQDTTQPFLVELQTSAGPLAYVVAHAGTEDDARAFIDAQLGRSDDTDDVIIVSVHPIH